MRRNEARDGSPERVLIEDEPARRPKARAFDDFLAAEFRIDPRTSNYGDAAQTLPWLNPGVDPPRGRADTVVLTR